MRRKYWVFGLIFLALIGCGKQEANKLILISPHWEGIETEFTNAFQEWYQAKTGKSIELEWLDQGGTADDLRYVESEFKRNSSGIGIDLFFGGGTDTAIRMANQGILHSYKLPEAQLAALPQTLFGLPLYDAEQFQWYGTAISSFGIMSNLELAQRFELPTVEHWQDMTHPALFKQVGAADPRSSGSAHMAYEIILQVYGWDEGFALLTKMAGNVINFTAGASAIPADIREGKVTYGPAIDFYAYEQINALGSETIGYVIPEEARVFGADPIAILKGAPNLEAAQLFVEFVLSVKGQQLWMLKQGAPGGPKTFALHRAAILPAAYDAVGENTVVPINPFKLTEGFQQDSRKGSERWNIVNELIGKLIIDPHPELIDAWKAIIALPEESPKRAQALDAFVALPITETEAQDSGQFEDPGYRNTVGSEWLKFALTKYKQAKEIASQP